MSKITPLYKFVYLESGDIIYPFYDSENMQTIEQQLVGSYTYFGQGIINGWNILWMNCKSDSFVMQMRQLLVDSYNTNPFSFYAIQYELLNYPVTDADWAQCIVVTTGLGIISYFHAATENPLFFRFTTVNNYYVWAQKNICTNTEYLCSIVAPIVPDTDYDLYNNAIFLGEVFVNTANSLVSVTQISYGTRRIELNNKNGYLQQQLQQLLINHVHSGEGNMPSKINLDTKITIVVPIIANNTALSFVYPHGFVLSNYNAIPQVFLNGQILPSSSYQISGTEIFLQNSISVTSVLQIVYQILPGKNIFITDNLNSIPDNIISPINPTGSNVLSYSTIYYLTDGTYVRNDDGTTTLNIFKWDVSTYSLINVLINNLLQDPSTYILDNNRGTLQFLGPILPSIGVFQEYQTIVQFVIPSFQVTGILPSSRIKSIDAGSFTAGKIPQNRMAGLDHLGFFRYNEPAKIIPSKLLLDSGDHIHFYPVIDSPIQLIDFIYYANTVDNIKIDMNEASTPSRTIISTANGLYATKLSALDFADIVQIPWNTDNGIANLFSENYYGNFANIKTGTTQNINPQFFWILCKSINQFKDSLFLSTDFGASYNKITLPIDSTNNYVNVNDFLLTLDPRVVSSGDVVITESLDVNYLYYLATPYGLYSATLLATQNPDVPNWDNPNKNTTNYATGSINKISEAVNVAVNTSSDSSGNSNTNYPIYRTLYAACDSGLFLYNSGNGTLFTSNSSKYNTDHSKFNYVKWFGNDEGSKNISANIVWSDDVGVYATLSAQHLVFSTDDATNTSTTNVFTQPLSLNISTFSGQYGIANSILCASTANIDLTTQITSVDGVTLTIGSGVLVKNQNNVFENGIYTWDVNTKRLFNTNSANPSYVLISNGSLQSQTEWIDLTTLDGSRMFGLWFANIINLTPGDYVVSAVKDQSNGPGSSSGGTLYTDSYFIATTKYIYRVLVNNNTPNIFPIVLNVPWMQINADGSSTNIYGNITEIQHYYSNLDIENGILVVFTENGIFRSSDQIWATPSTLSYQRFNTAFSPSQAAQASVYDDYTLGEYTGAILSVQPITIGVAVTDGTYLNNHVYSNTPQTSNYPGSLTVDIVILNGSVNKVIVNNPGTGYLTNINQGFAIINNVKVLINATSQGVFIADSNSQSLTYSNGTVFPSNLLYEVEYNNFYIQPWSGEALVTIQINNQLSKLVFTYNSAIGLISLNSGQPSIGLQEKNNINVSLSNIGQYISNAGDTPHLEVFNVTSADSNYTTTLSSTFDPTTSNGNNLLPLTNFNNTQWNANITLVKISGLRPSVIGGTVSSQYSEIVQVYVDFESEKVYIQSKPTLLQLTSGSFVYIARATADLLGIEDKITLSKTNHTYHLDSVSHANVYNLYNTLLNIQPNLFNYTSYAGEVLTGVNRGLQNTLAINSLAGFDPSATFTGFSFGVSPSSSDIPASPSTINLILDFKYGNDPIFTTDKGIWTYNRAKQIWSKIDSLNNSQTIYFANKKLTDSTNTAYNFSGTNLGLFYQDNGVYIQNPLFTEPVLSLSMGDWFTKSTTQSTRYEAYGLSNNLSFVLRTTDNISGKNTFSSDFFSGHNIYDIYYNTFRRYDDNGSETDVPALYVGTDIGLYAFTTSPLTGSPSDNGDNHTLLVHREMFGANAIHNINILNPLFSGPLSKIYKIVPLPPVSGSAIWLAICSSNGVYIVINWKACDVGDPAGLTFFAQNKGDYNKTIGRNCYVLIPKINSNSVYFVGTDQGIFKSIDRCYSWNAVSKFGNKILSVNDLISFTNNNIYYLVASTNVGLWVSIDDGDTWTAIQNFNDVNISLSAHPTNGIPLNQSPQQIFKTLSSGSIAEAFIYFDPSNLTGITTLYAQAINGLAKTISSTSITLNQNSYPGMYGFGFTSTIILPNVNYTLGIVTDNALYASQITWNLSTQNNPYNSGFAQTSGGIILNKDFFFQISLNTPGLITEIIEPVGFYNTNYNIGFASGTFSGASISSSGSLYSNVGVLCNIVIDTSRSFEINDQSIITQAGISSDYTRQAIINALVPSGVSTNNLYTRLSNGFGTSKFLATFYGFNNTINDLLFYTNSGNSNCLSISIGVTSGYTNTPSDLQNAVSYVQNNGRLSVMYDAILYNSRLQFPTVVQNFYANNLNLIDSNFINVQSIKLQYRSNFELFLQLNAVLSSTNNYTVYYQSFLTPFLWTASDYSYNIIVYSDGTSAICNTLNPLLGTFIDTSGKSPVYLLLSKDWIFDLTISDLSSSFSDVELSPEALKLALLQYSYSYKPLIILLTDGNDNSQATANTVNDSLKVSWGPEGTQLLIVEPSMSGNQNKLKEIISGTNSKILEYSTYPENDIKNILFINDNLNIFESKWSREFDFDNNVFISYIYTSFQTPGNSKASVSFSWSPDRINFSNFITLPNSIKFNLNQQVLSIKYLVVFTEDYSNGRILPYITQLYHVSVIPYQQTYLSYPQNIDGQLFETLSMASFSNNQSSFITPIVGRTASTDISYYETTNLNRNGALSNRQSSYRITAPYVVDGLQLFPSSSTLNSSTGITTYNYLQFYVVDSNDKIYTWSNSDSFILFANGIPISPVGYSSYPTEGQVGFALPQNYILANGTLAYTMYSAEIQYAETSETIIGEPTHTSDYKTYYATHGRFPTDAYVVILVNQLIYRGSYQLSPYDGSVTFSITFSPEDYVTIFIKFSNVFRTGLQILSYSQSNLSLQSFNFTYTNLSDLPTYLQSFNYSNPYLTSGPQILPVLPNINSLLQINYNYTDDNNSPENGSIINWWRQRTGIEYITFDPNYNLKSIGTSFTGIQTFLINSQYGLNPYIISATVNSIGLNTNITSINIIDRGNGLIGTNTNCNNISTNSYGYTISNIGFGITAYTQTPNYVSGFATTDYFVRINPLSPIGYSGITTGYSGSVTLNAFPNYDSLTNERTVDIGTRTLFDFRDIIFATVAPNNGFSTGRVYTSGFITLSKNYTPIISNLSIYTGFTTFNGVSTSLNVHESVNQYAVWYFNSNNPTGFAGTQYSYNTTNTIINWFKLLNGGPTPISNLGLLNSNLININDQIYCSVIPGILNYDGTIGYGNTVNSNIYTVSL